MRPRNDQSAGDLAPAAGEADRPPTIGVQFARLRLGLSAGLICCFTLPLIALSAYFHFQFNSTLKNAERLSLSALAESQRNTIDLFLQERVANLFSLFHYPELSAAPTREQMAVFLQNLRRASDSFVDVGFLDMTGFQIGYAGPFSYLQGKNYREEAWFQELLAGEKSYHISDVYRGFRNKPHFTIAARQLIGGRYHVLRTTLDPDKFYTFLRTISHGRNVDSSIVNDRGFYQVVDPGQGKLSRRSDFAPPRSLGTGFAEIGEGALLVAHAWLTETHWALLVRQPADRAHAKMLRARRILTAAIAGVWLLATAVIVYSVKRIVDTAEAATRRRQEMHLQLLHASKLAALGELATGVAHEINNPLAIITAAGGVIRDMLDPGFQLTWTPQQVLEQLDTIDSAAFRARGITSQLLRLGRKSPPRAAPCNLNEVVAEVVSGVVEKELRVEDIRLDLVCDPEIPDIMVDSDRIRQVFLNLINNARDAIEGPGTVTVTTGVDERFVKVQIKDTGLGMTIEEIDRAFDPFFTTKEAGKGTGLGLSVSLNIVESMGGAIDVQSIKGSGSVFTVLLPKTLAEDTGNHA